MRCRIKYGLLLIGVFIGFFGYSQKFSATVNVNTVSVGQHFKLTYSLNTSGDNFNVPALQDFQILSGPNQSTSMQYVNGQMSQSISFSYILSPVKEGKLNIPPASIDVNGNTIQSNPVTINVIPPTQAQQQQQRQQQQQKQAQQKQLTDNVFLKLFISKRKVYQGEQIIATYKIYTRLNIVNTGIDQWPAFNGFFSQDINDKSHNQLQPEVVNGMQFNSAVLKQVVLSPQRSGKIEIDPLNMDVIVRIRDERAARNVFDQFFGMYKDVELNLKSNGATIDVKPLPSKGKTPSFKGAVGDFKLNSSIDKQEVKTNEAINLKIAINGNGNIKLINDPEINFPPDFEVYDPKENSKVNTSANGVSGSKTFEYLIIPRHSGNFVIPSVEFSFFDAKQGKYKTLRTEEYAIKVNRAEGEEETQATAVRPVRKKDVALLGRDIRYIKKNATDLKEAGYVFFGSRLFWLLMSLPSILFAGLLIVRKRVREMNADVVGLKRRKASKVASQFLKNAKKHLDEGNTNEFYEDVFRSLYNYMSMKLNIPVSELDKEYLAERLKENGIEEELIQQFTTILSECEMARYAPSAAMNEQELYSSASEVINKIDGQLK